MTKKAQRASVNTEGVGGMLDSEGTEGKIDSEGEGGKYDSRRITNYLS